MGVLRFALNTLGLISHHSLVPRIAGATRIVSQFQTPICISHNRLATFVPESKGDIVRVLFLLSHFLERVGIRKPQRIGVDPFAA